jgi:uncharacterized RDD family membrane protein YckC
MADVHSVRPGAEEASPVRGDRRPARGRDPAGRDLRLLACLLDVLLMALALTPGFLVLYWSREDRVLYVLALVLLNLGGLAVAAVTAVMLGTAGQTLGKKLLGLRIVRVEDEANPGYVKAVLLRGHTVGMIAVLPVCVGLYYLTDLAGLIALSPLVAALLGLGGAVGLIGQIPVVGSLFLLVDAFFVFGDDQRCLHDYLAGTKVVMG